MLPADWQWHQHSDDSFYLKDGAGNIVANVAQFNRPLVPTVNWRWEAHREDHWDFDGWWGLCASLQEAQAEVEKYHGY